MTQSPTADRLSAMTPAPATVAPDIGALLVFIGFAVIAVVCLSVVISPVQRRRRYVRRIYRRKQRQQRRLMKQRETVLRRLR